VVVYRCVIVGMLNCTGNYRVQSSAGQGFTVLTLPQKRFLDLYDIKCFVVVKLSIKYVIQDRYYILLNSIFTEC
jgi:hypothetical protein